MMEAIIRTTYGPTDVLQLKEVERPDLKDDGLAEAFAELERGVHAALETYSNVHRGSGHNSMVSTHLYEQAREIVLETLGLNKDKYVVIFCTPRRAEALKAQLEPESYQSVSSQDIGLSLGVRALAVARKALPRGTPFQTGGGTARLVSPGWVIWAKAPDKFEAGTPAIVNVIAFAKALRLIQHFGNDAFQEATAEKLTAAEILYHDGLEKYSGRELLDELRQTLIGRSVRVPTVEGARRYINLDNSASTPTFTPIWDTVRQAWRQPRQVQQEIIHEVRSICAGALGAPLAAYDVIFTSNTTEAINLMAESLGNESEPGVESVVLNTLLEHNSNELPWRMVPGFSLIRLPVDAEGFVDLNELEALLGAYNQKGQHGKKRIKLVAVSGASNVLGVFSNLAEISRMVHRHGARLLVDAAQLVAHRKVEMERCGIDYLAFSAHKVYAPFGTGVLLVRKGLLHFSPAELELIQSSGEENVGGIAALGKALVLLQRIGLDLIQEEEQALTGRALRGLAQIPGLTIYGVKDPDSPRFAHKGGVIVFRLEGMMANRVAKELAERGGIGVRSGCHCAHLLIKRLLNIHPLLAQLQGLILTLFPQVALPGLTRVSLGIENGAEDIDTLIHVLGKIPRPEASSRNRMPVLPQTDVQRQMDDFARAAARRVYTL
jgi:selenocysteine lyase/cysteine desulfurase